MLFTEAVECRCSVEYMSLETSPNWQENTCTRVSDLIKSPYSCKFIKKKDYATGIFLWI